MTHPRVPKTDLSDTALSSYKKGTGSRQPAPLLDDASAHCRLGPSGRIPALPCHPKPEVILAACGSTYRIKNL